jgi:hypothetical protein
MYQHACVNCGQPMSAYGYHGGKCPVCVQTKAIEAQTKALAQQTKSASRDYPPMYDDGREYEPHKPMGFVEAIWLWCVALAMFAFLCVMAYVVGYVLLAVFGII